MLGLLSKLVRKRTDGRWRLANLFVAAIGGGGHDEKEEASAGGGCASRGR